jgi:hypothetical protein
MRLNRRWLIPLVLVNSSAALAAVDDARGDALDAGPTQHFFVAALGEYDDNLFRLPTVLSAAQRNQLTGATRFDFLQTGSLGYDGTFFLGIQELLVDLRLDYNRFADNQILNNASGSGKLEWDWQLSTVWSGKVGANYTRALASFANNYFLGKDSLETTNSYGEIDWLIGPHVSTNLVANHTTSNHSAAVRTIDDYALDTGEFNVNYVDSHANVFGWNYAFSKGRYPHTVELAGQPFDRSFHDNTSAFHVKYQLTGKLALQGNYGYLKRTYPNATIGNFSGDIWRAALTWQATAKSALVVSAWRELNAYVDSQSDYFVTQGVSVGPSWQPFEKLSLKLSGSHERQNYIGSNVGPLSAATRRDVITAGVGSLSWQPRQYLSAVLSYRYERRSSDIATLIYNDNLFSLSLRFTL